MARCMVEKHGQKKVRSQAVNAKAGVNNMQLWPLFSYKY